VLYFAFMIIFYINVHALTKQTQQKQKWQTAILQVKNYQIKHQLEAAKINFLNRYCHAHWPAAHCSSVTTAYVNLRKVQVFLGQ